MLPFWSDRNTYGPLNGIGRACRIKAGVLKFRLLCNISRINQDWIENTDDMAAHTLCFVPDSSFGLCLAPAKTSFLAAGNNVTIPFHISQSNNLLLPPIYTVLGRWDA